MFVTLLNGEVCGNSITIKLFEFGYSFDVFEYGKVCSCAYMFSVPPVAPTRNVEFENMVKF